LTENTVETEDVEPLESQLGIDPEQFDVVFSQVWDSDEDPADRVHIDTEVESEVLRVVDDWADQIHNSAGNAGGSDDGLFLVIEGAQATGKTTMTRYIRNELDPTENPNQSNIPMIIPVWDSTDPNPTSFKYRNLLREQGRRVFEELDVPGIDEKVSLLNGMGAELSEEQLSRVGEQYGTNPEQVRGILGEYGFEDGEHNAKEVVKQLANEGYLFLFIFDEMVSENDAGKAKSVLKWFKDHLYPYVGLVLFSHPDVSSAIKNEMQDQATRRNIDRTLEIAGDNYDIKEDIVINIRRKQHRIVDLEKLLSNYFSEVYVEEDHPEYGPLTEENIEWMNELLAAGGLIGNLVNGINTAIERYAEDGANGYQNGKLGTYLFDECSRHMSHVQIKHKLAGNSDLDPNEDSEVVRRAKELITRSISLEDLGDEIKAELEDNRCLIEDPDTGDLQLNPYVANYEESDYSRPRETVSRPEDDEIDELATYREAVTSFSDDKANDRGTLRKNVDVALTTLLERVNSEQINIAKSSTLTLPGGKTPQSEFIEIVGSSTTGRAEKIEIEDGDLSDYNYRLLLTALFSDESLNEPEIKNEIQEWFDGDNGILIVTNKDEDEFTEPDWFNNPISRQQWRDNEYTWGDVTRVIHVNRLRELLGLYRHLQEQDFEDDSEILAEIRRLSNQSRFPELPDFDDIVTNLYENNSESIRYIHDNIYEKYDGPTLSEAEAFSAILDEVKDRGFISDRVLDELREEHGVEIESLIKKGGIKEFTTEDGRTVIYLKEDFGSTSKLGTVSDKRELFPVGPEVFETLEEFHEMEADRITRSDDEISNLLEDLEQKLEVIDFFLYEEDKLSDIKDQIEDSDASTFDDVLDKISEAKNTDEEDFGLVRENFESDQDIWTKIQGLEVDDDISPIHRELFYAKLPEQPPNWAEDYLEDDRQYPILIYNLYQTIQEILEELNALDESVSEDFEEQSGDLDDYRSNLEEFVGTDSDSNGEDVELNDSSSEDLIELSTEDLKDFDYTGYIVDIAENESKRSNLSSATSLLTRVDGIRDDFVKVTQKDSLDEISHETASEYTDVGKKIAQKLLEDEVLFDDESDEPELIIQDFQKFCTQIEKVLQDSERLKTLEESEEDEKERVESIPGDDVDAKIEYLENKIEDLENAERYLKLKEEHCEVCKSDWEDLSPERKEEINKELERMQEKYSDVDFSLDSIGQAKEETKEQKETADDVEGELEEIRKKKSQIDLNEFTSELSALRKKYASD
jgi:hypothetical protein